MKLLRAIAVAAAIFVLAPPPPASAQISPNAVWSCEFTNSPTDCGLYLEAGRAERGRIPRPPGGGPTTGAADAPPGVIQNTRRSARAEFQPLGRPRPAALPAAR